MFRHNQGPNQITHSDLNPYVIRYLSNAIHQLSAQVVDGRAPKHLGAPQLVLLQLWWWLASGGYSRRSAPRRKNGLTPAAPFSTCWGFWAAASCFRLWRRSSQSTGNLDARTPGEERGPCAWPRDMWGPPIASFRVILTRHEEYVYTI